MLPRTLVIAVTLVALSFTPTSATAQPGAPGLNVSLNKSAFVPGDVMVVTAHLAPITPSRPVDAYIVIQAPGGIILSLQLNGTLVFGLVPLARGFVPFPFAGVAMQYAFTGAEPLGTYTWYSVLTEPGTLAFASPLQQLPFTFDTPPATDEDETPSSAIVTLGGGISETAFNATGASVTFDVAGGLFGDTVALFRNGQPVTAGLVATPTALQVSNLLVAGRNALTLVAQDAVGATIYQDFVVWAGGSTLLGSILDQASAAAAGVTLTARLGDDADVVQTTTSNASGQFQFSNLPNRTIIVDAFANGNRIASLATTGGAGSILLKLTAIGAPSAVANNDFSLGTAGWAVGAAPVTIVAHSEAATSGDSITAGPDMDLVLNTSGPGPQSISRTFTTASGTQNVTVRFRFITTEVPGGYFGTQYNDYFSVSLRSAGGGGLVTDSRSMNGLGLAAFTPNGATAWRELTLPVSSGGDTVQVDVTVANVADGLLDSRVVVDLVNEKTLSISALALKDIDGSNLTHLSTDAHSYFGGNTRVHGTITVEGAATDGLQSLVLEIVQGGSVRATAQLSASAAATLLQPFGAAKKVTLAVTQLLFELPSAQAAAVNGTTDGTLTLRVRAQSTSGEIATKDVGAVQLLVKYDGANRYGGRDAVVGGDDWLLPSMSTLISGFSGLTWGDFSNMNGGKFSPHASHDTGLDGDGWFSGYNARNAGTAATIIGHLNSPSGANIGVVFVTFQQLATDPFWLAIRNVVLNDGRRARDIIQPVGGHTTHFHWRRK